jgi:hypothetical protein
VKLNAVGRGDPDLILHGGTIKAPAIAFPVDKKAGPLAAAAGPATGGQTGAIELCFVISVLNMGVYIQEKILSYFFIRIGLGRGEPSQPLGSFTIFLEIGGNGLFFKTLEMVHRGEIRSLLR